MLRNFHLAAIVGSSSAQRRLRQIPLERTVQRALATAWWQQYRRFVADVTEVDFTPGYKPEPHERFCLSAYRPPPWLASESSQTVVDLDPIGSDETALASIRATVAFARSNTGQELVLFQNFTRSRVIRPGRFLFLESGTYVSLPNPGITLDSGLSAVYSAAATQLLFGNFRTVNTFLPLYEFFEEASEAQIREVLSHDALAAENVDAIAVGANQWFRTRFAMLRDSGILDTYSGSEIESRAERYGVPISLQHSQIVFPAKKTEAKRLLQFLNEEIFRGAITSNLYETNSKRRTDP